MSRPTIRDAIGVLRAEGVVIAEHGKGVFVRPVPPVIRLGMSRLSRAAWEANRGAFLGDAAAGGFTPSTTVRISFEPADVRVADLLEIDPGTDLCIRDRVMSADNAPVQLSVSRFPRRLTTDTAIERENTGPGGVYARLEEAGHRLARYTETVGARMPTPAEAATLQLISGTPVITVTRVAYTTTDTPVEVNDIVMAADRFALVYDIPAD